MPQLLTAKSLSIGPLALIYKRDTYNYDTSAVETPSPHPTLATSHDPSQIDAYPDELDEAARDVIIGLRNLSIFRIAFRNLLPRHLEWLKEVLNIRRSVPKERRDYSWTDTERPGDTGRIPSSDEIEGEDLNEGLRELDLKRKTKI